MKRVLVFGLVGTNRGGIETFLLNMNQAMTKDCVFDYVVEETSCIHLPRILAKGGAIYHVPPRNSHPLKNIKSIIKILKQKKEKYCCTYFNLSSLSWILPIIFSRKYKYRTFVHSHNAELIDKNSSFLYRVANALNKRVLSHCKITRLACSKYAANFMFGRKREWLQINNGIFIENFAFREEYRKKWRTALGLDDNCFLIGFAGRIAYQKNPLFALDIFKNVSLVLPNSAFVVAGDGALMEECKQFVREEKLESKVFFIGNILEVNELYSAMDFFLLPSRHEGLGIVLIEAQASGLRALTSKNVVPDEALITDLVITESLSESSSVWAKRLLDFGMASAEKRRMHYAQIVEESGFSIEKEALKLEKILCEE